MRILVVANLSSHMLLVSALTKLKGINLDLKMPTSYSMQAMSLLHATIPYSSTVKRSYPKLVHAFNL